MKQRLLNILSVDLLNTIRVNSQLPFKQFIKFPIWVYKCKVDSLPPQPVRERLFGVYHRGQNRYHDST